MRYCYCPVRRLTVEPLAFLALFCLSLLDQVTQQYVFNKLQPKTEPAQQNVTNITNLINTCNTTTTASLYFAGENILRSEAGQWSLYLKLAAMVPSLFTSLILGMWSDQAGRKIVLLLASCGGLIQVSIHLLVINLDLEIYILLIGNIAYGLSGYATLIIAVCMAYTADITSKQERTIQIVLLSTIIGVGSGLAKFISGYWIDTYGLVPPLWLIFGCNIASMVYIKVFIPETIIREYRSITLGNWKAYILNICRFLSNNVCRGIWFRLITIYLVTIFVVEVVQAGCYELMFTYSINWPICFGAVYMRYLSGVVTCTFITSIVAVKLFQLLPWLSDHWIIQFGLLSAVGGLTVAAFAKTAFFMFMVSVAALLSQIPLAVLRSATSKAVDFRQQGLLFAVVGCIVSIGWIIGYLVFNSLYHATKHIMTGMSFLLGAGVLIIPMILLGITHYYQGCRSYNIFVDSMTSQDEGSSDSEDSETVPIIGQNQIRGNHSYQSL